MNLRISAGAAALALVAALALAGCGSDGSSDGSSPSPPSTAGAADQKPTAADVAALAGVKVQGDAGKEPTLSFDKGLTVSVPTARKVEDGTGDALKNGMEVTLHYVIYQSDGTRVGSTWQEGQGNPDTVILGDSQLGVINDVLQGTHVGARALVANPSTGQDGTTTTMVMLFEVAGAKTIPTRAEGEPVTPAAGLPTVTLAADGKPSIKVPDGFADPTDLVVQPLIKGSGPAVTATQTLTVQYTGWLKDGTQFDSSWDRGLPTSFPLSNVIQGWTEGLTGQTVGSQVLLVVPAAKGYGANAQGSIPANSTLIFVVDILDAH